jgi:anhydro-N-acetylmuramic acid kinase
MKDALPDISPVNTVFKFYSNKLGMDYDDKGQHSRTGKINDLLKGVSLKFYQKTNPKSLGFEFVKEVILPLINASTLRLKTN